MSTLFARFASFASRLSGNAVTFLVCVVFVLVWAATGPVFHFSETWQLVINTSATIITFLMVFLIQNTQNRDNEALQIKLDELIRVTQASNEYAGIEKLSDKELEALHRQCRRTIEEAQRVLERTNEVRGSRSAVDPPTDAVSRAAS